ncbi:hypothetical protein D3C77_597170 [compost metagenome]
MTTQVNTPGQAQRVDTGLQHLTQRAFADDCQLQARLVRTGLGECPDQHLETLAFHQPPDRAQHYPGYLRQLQGLPGRLPAQQRLGESQRVEGHAQGLHRPAKLVFE